MSRGVILHAALGRLAGIADTLTESPPSVLLARAGELVGRFGSPLYAYDAEAVRRAYREVRAAFDYEETRLHYAVVCNKNPYLVRVLTGLGAGVHANTPGDAHAALAAGVSPERIVYSGTNLDAADLDYLLARRRS
jgi:diaminopimelate decarboxylase